jgi:phosphatidylglycerophosphatase A
MNPTTETADALQMAKPRFAFAFATVLGVGYLKPAPGTWGSVVGLFIAVISHPFTWFLLLGQGMNLTHSFGFGVDLPPLLTGFWGIVILLLPSLLVWLIFAWLGVTTSTKVANFSGVKDPQFVVIDEVSGVHLTLILALIPLSPCTLA